MGCKEEEVIGRRVRSVNGCPPNLLTRQNKNQPEREILAHGENPEIRKIRNKKNSKKQNYPKIPPNVSAPFFFVLGSTS